MRSPRALSWSGRLVAGEPRLQVVDACKQLARQQGAGDVQAEVAAQSRYGGDARRGLAREERGCEAAAGRLGRAEAHEAAHQVGMEAGLAGEDLDLHERPLGAGTPERDRLRLARAYGGRHQPSLRGLKLDVS